MGREARAVKMIDPETGKVLQTYPSISQAAKENYTETSSICHALNGRQKHHLGYKWERA